METLKAYIETHRDTIVDIFAKTFYTGNLSPERKSQIVDWTYKAALNTNLDYYRPQNWLPERLAPVWNRNYRLFPCDSPYTFGVPKLIREKGQILLTPEEVTHWKACVEEEHQKKEYENWKKKRAKEEAELAKAAESKLKTPSEELDEILKNNKTKRTCAIAYAFAIVFYVVWLYASLALSINLIWMIVPTLLILATIVLTKRAQQKEAARIQHIKLILLTPQEVLNEDAENRQS